MKYDTQRVNDKPEVGKTYADVRGHKVRVHAVCQSHVVYRNQPYNELDASTREVFKNKYLTRQSK